MNETDKRERYILGDGPRISPLPAESIDDDAKRAITDLWKAIGIAPRPEIPEFFATLVRHPPLMLKHSEYATQLLASELAPRHRQLAIIRIAWLCQAPFEWSQHVKNSRNFAGLSEADTERATLGSVSANWDDQDLAILRAVEEMYDDAMISDATWRDLSSFLNDKQLLELPLLVGFYQSVAYLQNSVRFRLMPGSKGLSER